MQSLLVIKVPTSIKYMQILLIMKNSTFEYLDTFLKIFIAKILLPNLINLLL